MTLSRPKSPVSRSLLIAGWLGIQATNSAAFVNEYDHRNETALAVDGTIYLTGYDEEHGYELWKSDGTAAGTALLKDLVPGAESSDPMQFTLIGNTVYFVAGSGLWKTDGTPGGTARVKQYGFAMFPNYRPQVAWKNELYFSQNSFGSRQDLVKSDGTAKGTVKIAELQYQSNHFPDGFFAHSFTAAGDLLYFIVDSGYTGDPRTLWRTDGTKKGTFQIGADLFTQPELPVTLQAKLYFRAFDKKTGTAKLWKTTGDDADTEKIPGFHFGNSSNSDGSNMIKMGSRLFVMNGGLWKTEGEKMQFVDTPGRFQSPAVYKGPFDRKPRLYFCSDGPGGFELWRTEGNRQKTRFFKDLSPGYSYPNNFKVAGNRLFFRAGYNGDGDNILWTSLGTKQSTTRLKRFDDPVHLLGSVGRKQLFLVDGNGVDSLWISDGTIPGTLLLVDVPRVKK